MPSRVSPPVPVPAGVEVTVIMIVAVVDIVIVMVEASVISVFSVTGEGPVKKVPVPLKGNSWVPWSMRAVSQLCL